MNLPTRPLPSLCLRMGALIALAMSLAMPAHAASYVGALGKARYSVLSGDVNGDGKPDLLVKAQPTALMIPLDDDLLIPIMVAPTSPTYVLLSSVSGNYTLAAPSTPMLAYGGWTPANYAVSFSGVAGAYAGSMTLTSALVAQPNFVVSMTADSGQLHLTGTSSARPMLAFDCSSFTPATAPATASANCALTNLGTVGLNAISYSTIPGATVSGPTGTCAARSGCGTVHVTTGTAIGSYSGMLTATPDTGSAASYPVNLAVTAPLVNNAQFIAQSVGSSMLPGQPYPMTVSMLNNGTSTWAANANYKLGSYNPRDNTTWGTGRVIVDRAVGPGQSHTFTFNITAPLPGVHNLQGQMLEEGKEWFGAPTTNIGVTINQPPPINTWNAVAAAFNTGDKSKVLPYFMNRAKYDALFSEMGSKLADLGPSLSEFNFIEITPRYANAVVTQTVGGVSSRHFVSFVFVDGAWMIADF